MDRITIALACAASMLACDSIAGDSRQRIEPYCDTNEKATVCETNMVALDCYEGALPQTNGACALVLESRFQGDEYVEPYIEDIYCCHQ
jgi:hypothetical protein